MIGSYYETHTTERIVYCADLLLTYGVSIYEHSILLRNIPLWPQVRTRDPARHRGHRGQRVPAGLPRPQPHRGLGGLQPPLSVRNQVGGLIIKTSTSCKNALHIFFIYFLILFLSFQRASCPKMKISIFFLYPSLK